MYNGNRKCCFKWITFRVMGINQKSRDMKTTGTGTSTTISNLSPGTFTYKVTNSSGCTSPASANVVINTQPTTPAVPTVGTITSPTCTTATGSVVLNGLPSGIMGINQKSRRYKNHRNRNEHNHFQPQSGYIYL